MSQGFRSTYTSYTTTGYFSKIVLDYISGDKGLQDFYIHPVNPEGVQSAIKQRNKFNINRQLLTEQLQLQYRDLNDSDHVNANIDALAKSNTYTVCTAHQPNIFAGHLYFIYKILHTIRLADELKKQLPDYNFVPVFFMGSEDADLEELNHIVLEGRKYVWHTNQSGAVGRMKVDDLFLKLVEEISGRVSVEKYGKDIITLVKKCFLKNDSIEHSTFLFLHYLFQHFGLVVFLPDNPALKNAMIPVFEEDIFKNTSSQIVGNTSAKLAARYKVQAHPREINLFYLKDNLRNRIIQVNDQFAVHDTDITFNKNELIIELKEHPDRFSPNVILRGLYQETMLPNLAFIGGGGELAYWLELKDMFGHYQVPFPMLILRNSFLIIGNRFQKMVAKMGLVPADLFRGKEVLLGELVRKQSHHRLNLEEEIAQVKKVYASIHTVVHPIDPTLEQHTEALATVAVNKIMDLEKKILRAEKRKFSDQNNQLEKIFSALFPEGNLQERTDNFMLLYAQWGNDFLKLLYDQSLTFEQEFCLIEEIT